MNNEKKPRTYYPDPKDDMWNQEVESILPYLTGEGIDIGCGDRSIKKGDVRVDLDPKNIPDEFCSGDELPFEDLRFDYLSSIHSFEHFKDQEKLMREWARVIKKGGIIGIVHPDVNYTGIHRPDGLREGENPFNEHYHEKTLSDFKKWFKKYGDFGLDMIDSGEACPNWSFFIVLRKR